MKKTISILSLIILTSLFWLSCRQDNLATTNLNEDQNKNFASSAKITADGLELTPETFNIIGETHNNALDYIYNNQISNNINSNYEDINNSGIHYIFNVDENMKLTSDNPQLLQTSEQKANIKYIVENAGVLSMSEIIMKYKTITENQKKYIDLLDQAVNSSNLTYDNIIRNIKQIEEDAINELSDNEIVYFLGMSSVAKSSLEYWNTSRGEKWFTSYGIAFKPIGSFSTNTANKISWRNVAIADIVAFGYGFPSGVTVGMVAGGLAVGVGTAGVGAGIGAVLGGLIGGSASGLAHAAVASGLTLGAEKIADIWGLD